jgi:hypothetical protein
VGEETSDLQAESGQLRYATRQRLIVEKAGAAAADVNDLRLRIEGKIPNNINFVPLIAELQIPDKNCSRA